MGEGYQTPIFATRREECLFVSSMEFDFESTLKDEFVSYCGR